MTTKPNSTEKSKWWKISLSTIISIVALSFSIYQFRIQNRRAEVQIEDLKSERELRLDENRPYFSYNGFSQFGFPNNDSIYFLLKFKNIGQSPAYNSVTEITIAKTDSIISKKDFLTNKVYCGSNPINKDQNIEIYGQKFESDSEKKCFIFVSISYRDILTEKVYVDYLNFEIKSNGKDGYTPFDISPTDKAKVEKFIIL